MNFLSDVDDEEEEPPPPSVVARALKSPLVPVVPSAVSFYRDRSFADASVLFTGAAFVAVVVVKSSKVGVVRRHNVQPSGGGVHRRDPLFRARTARARPPWSFLYGDGVRGDVPIP